MSRPLARKIPSTYARIPAITTRVLTNSVEDLESTIFYAKRTGRIRIMHIASIKRGLGPRRNEMAELEFSAKQGLTNFGALRKFLGQQVDLMVERIRKGEWPDRRDYLENCRADQDRDSFIQTVCSECRITYCTRKEANGAAD